MKEGDRNINYTGCFATEGPDFLKIETENIKHNPIMSSTLDISASTSKDKTKDQLSNCSIISRTNGWLTVDSKTMSRKNAFEKHLSGTNGLDNKTTSPLSPDWMQRVNLLAAKARSDLSHTEL